MKKTTSMLLALTLIGVGSLSTSVARAQGTSFPDVPQNHWAYQAVQDLADKGYVKGYPDGKFLGKRAMTRYEFASVIDRMAQTIEDLRAKVGTPPATPTGVPVTQDDLNKLQALVDSFRTQLDAIQSVVAGASGPFQDQLDALRQDVNDTKDLVAKAQASADNSYGTGANRKYQISGYIQARYQQADTKTQSRYPYGNPTPSGAGQYNGNYAQGGNSASFLLRRSRLKVTGKVTGNTAYAIQIDASGATTVGGQSVSVREGNVSYTLGDGDTKLYPTLTAGLFANPFGYQLPLSSSSILSPERPLAFNEGGAGLFTNQDYDRGFQVFYGPTNLSGFKLTFAAVNGTGLASNAVDRVGNEIYRVAYQTPNKVFGAGVSFYNGSLPGTGIGNGTPATGTTPAVPAYQDRKKQLFGADAQYISPSGPFLLAEYIGGTYEQRSYFASPTATGLTTNYVKGNKNEGYYVQGGYTFAPTGNHPFTLAASYDVFRRSKSGVAATATGGASGSSFDDENLGYGLLYNLDKATRIRFWYEHPDKVAHAAGTAAPPKYGLFTTELQVKF